MSNQAFRPAQHAQHTQFPYEPPRQPLRVSDVVKLASAGVVIEFKDIAAQVQSDGPDYPPVQTTAPAMADAIWDRWHRTKRAGHEQFGFRDEGTMRPWQLFATQHGDTVHVFVAPRGAEPFVLTDAAAIFPSDALMASLALHEKLK